MRIVTLNRLVIQGYAALTLLTLAAIWAGENYLRLKDIASQRREASLQFADQLLAGSKILTNNVRAYAATGDPRYRAAFMTEMTVNRSRDKAVEGLHELDITNEENDLIEEAKAQSDQLIHLEERAFAAGEAGNLRVATELVYGPAYLAALDSIYGPIDQFREQLRARLAQAVELAHRRAQWAGWLARGLVVANMATVLGVFMLFYRRRVIQPLLALDACLLGQLSGQGDNPAIRYPDGDDEIGDLGRSLKAFVQMEERIMLQRQHKRQATELALALQQCQDINGLTQAYLSCLAEMLAMRHGLLHVINESGARLIMAGGYGVEMGDWGRETPLGEGLAGTCARERKPLRFDDPPRDYVRIVSGTGVVAPQVLLIRPLLLNERLVGVVEVAGFHHLDAEDMELLEDLERILILNLVNLQNQERRRSYSSQLQASEENLRAILNGMSEGIFSLDPDGRTLFINPAACRILGYKAEELLGSLAHTKVHHTYADGRPHPREDCPMYLTLMDGKTRQVDEDVMWRKDGVPVRVAYRTTAMCDSRGQCTGSVIAFYTLDSHTPEEET